jgi:VWFA-related protein
MRPISALLVVCASALAGLAAAQSPQTAPPAADLGTIARSSATEVLVDVVVLDKHGKPIKNLKASDVQLTEDEVKQDITSFRFISPAEQARTANAAKAAVAQTGPRSLRGVNLVCLVFHNLDPLSRRNAIEAAKEFLKTELPPETYVGIFKLDDNFVPVFPFTARTQEAANAVANTFSMRPMDFNEASTALLTANPTMATITATADPAGHSGGATMTITGGELANSSVGGAEVSTDLGANAMRGAQITENRDFSHLTGMRETDKVINMITQFAKLPGRKMVVLFSTGFSTTGDPDRFQQMVTKALNADITFYPFDVAGIRDNSTAQAGKLALGEVAGTSATQSVATRVTANTEPSGSLGAAKEKSRQEDTMNDAVRNSDVQASLRALAEDTGGFLTANTNEFKKPFQHIVEDIQTHYEITYRPSFQKYDGSLRTIQIKLSHPDWRVESRTSYFAVPDLKQFASLGPQDVLGLQILSRKPQPHAFDFHTAFFNFNSDGHTRQGELVIELPGGALTPRPNPGKGTDILRSQMFALIKDANGQVVDKFSLEVPYEVPDAKLKEIRETPLVYTHPLDLPMGRYTAETVAVDREGGRASTSSIEFDTTGPATGVSMSSALLIRRIEPGNPDTDKSGLLAIRGSRLVPFVETHLTPENKPYAYFVVYPNKANTAKPKLQIQLSVDNQVLADQTNDLPAPDATGAIPMVLRAAVHTGHCELKLTTIQGDETATRTLSYDVSAK